MLYGQTNTLRDTVTTLNLQGYRGNDLIVALTLLGDWPMPALVNCVASPGADALPFPAAMQPGVSISGRTVQLLFANTKAYKSTAAHAISFDGRVVLAGTLSFNRQTVGVTGPVNQSVSVGLVEGGIVEVTVLVGASAGGGAPEQAALIASEAIPIGRLVANVAGKAALYNPAATAHAYALVGISVQSAPLGSMCSIQSKGSITIPGWGLISGQSYRAGSFGNLSTTKPPASFSQIVGRALSADSFLFNPQPIIY